MHFCIFVSWAGLSQVCQKLETHIIKSYVCFLSRFTHDHGWSQGCHRFIDPTCSKTYHPPFSQRIPHQRPLVVVCYDAASLTFLINNLSIITVWFCFLFNGYEMAITFNFFANFYLWKTKGKTYEYQQMLLIMHLVTTVVNESHRYVLNVKEHFLSHSHIVTKFSGAVATWVLSITRCKLILQQIRYLRYNALNNTENLFWYIFNFSIDTFKISVNSKVESSCLHLVRNSGMSQFFLHACVWVNAAILWRSCSVLLLLLPDQLSHRQSPVDYRCHSVTLPCHC